MSLEENFQVQENVIMVNTSANLEYQKTLLYKVIKMMMALRKVEKYSYNYHTLNADNVFATWAKGQDIHFHHQQFGLLFDDDSFFFTVNLSV